MSDGEGRRLTGRKAEEVDAVDLPEETASRGIWVRFLAGPTLWFVHFMVVYLIVEEVCGRQPDARWLGGATSVTATLVATVGFSLAIVATTVWAYRGWRAEEERMAADGDEQAEVTALRGRDRLLDFAGFLLGPVSLLAVLLVGLPALWLPPC